MRSQIPNINVTIPHLTCGHAGPHGNTTSQVTLANGSFHLLCEIHTTVQEIATTSSTVQRTSQCVGHRFGDAVVAVKVGGASGVLPVRAAAMKMLELVVISSR